MLNLHPRSYFLYTVQEAVKQLGWVIADSTRDADVIWSDMSCGPDRLLKLQPHQVRRFDETNAL